MTLPRRAEAPPSGIPTWARVGAKVVCVDDSPSEWGHPCPLKIGSLYTITATFADCCHFNGAHDPGVWLAEVRREGFAFFVARFRPLISKSQDDDIAEFRKLLTGQPVRESERA